MDNRKIYIISTSGSLGTKTDSLESIIASNDIEIHGSKIDIDITSDGIAVLCRDGYFISNDNVRISVADNSTYEIKESFKKLVVLGQAVDMAKSCSQILAINPKNIKADAMIKISLKHADYTHKSFLMIDNPVFALNVCKKYSDINVMTYMSEKPQDIREFMFQMKIAGFFGFFADAKNISKELCIEAKLAGLFIGSSQTDNANDMKHLIDSGINFLITSEPKMALEVMRTDT